VALTLPPSFSLNNLIGGYQGQLDYTMLADNQTNYGRNVDLGYTTKQRNGYERILNTAFAGTGLKSLTGESGVMVNGHFQLIKAAGNTEVEKNIAAAGKNLWIYTSETASIILTGMTDAEDAIWNFAQIMSPTDGSDDVVVGVNGYDKPIIWNGMDASASYLSAVAGSSGVYSAKFMVSVKNRIFLLNIKDDTDVDAGSKFLISGFDSAGAPTPHVYPEDLMVYAGGSDRYGPITGAASLNGNVIIFKKNTHYLFTLGGSTIDEATLSFFHDFSLQQMDENTGCVAPKTIVSLGNMVMFLSDNGVYATDGASLVYLSEPIKRDLENINISRKQYASAVFHREKNQYWLSIAETGKDYNNLVFVYDLTKKIWYTPYDNMRCNIMSNFRKAGKQKILCGDHQGYMFELDTGRNDGLALGYNVTPKTFLNSNQLNFADSAAISVAGDGLYGLTLLATDSSGANVTYRTIIDHTGTQITVSPDYNASITTATTFAILGTRSFLRTKDFDFGVVDLDKVYTKIKTRTGSPGDWNFKVNYIIDFNEFSNAGTATVSVYDDRFLSWTAGDYATGTSPRYSGTIETVTLGASEINVSARDLSASNLAGYAVYYVNSGTRRVMPINSGECNTLELGLYGTASLVVTNTDTTYLINTNLDNTWGTALWGPANTTTKDISIRCLFNQPPYGRNMSLVFGNERANENWEILGFDIMTKVIGRR